MRELKKTLLAVALIPACVPAHAASRVWSSQASTATWDTRDASVWSGTAWKNGFSDTAEFRGKGGTITMAETISANALSFSGGDYVLKGESLKLGGQVPAISVAQGKTATLNCALTSTAVVTKDGPGTLKLSSKSSHSLPAKLTVTAGVLKLDGMTFGSEKMGPGGVLAVGRGAKAELLGSHVLGGSNWGSVPEIRIDGGELSLVSGSQYFGKINLRGATMTGGGTFRATTVTEIHAAGAPSRITVKEICGGWGGNVALTFAVDASGSDKPDLSVECPVRNVGVSEKGSGVLELKKTGAGVLELSAENDYRGRTLITEGIVRAAHASALGSTSSVQIAGGILTTAVENVSAGSLVFSKGELRLNGDTSGALTLAPDADLSITGGVWHVSVGATDSDRIVGSGKGVFAVSGLTLDFSGAAFSQSGDFPILSGFASGTVESPVLTGYDAEKWELSLDAAGMLHVRKLNPKWVIPVGVGGGLALVAGVVVFLIRRKKPAAVPAFGTPAMTPPPPPPPPPSPSSTRLPPPPPGA